MGVRMPSVASTTIVTATLVAATEAVVVTSPPLNIPFDFSLVLLAWYVEWLSGNVAGLTAFRIRRGTTTGGTQVNVNNTGITTPAAAQHFIASGFYVDTPGAVAEQQYSVTATIPSASSSGTVDDVSLLIFVL